MKLRFTRTPTTQQKTDYYRIREICYRDSLGMRTFDGSEDAWDRRSHLLIALDGELCIGGVRINGCPMPEKGPYPAIPLEDCGLVLPELLPELGLEKKAYCEPTRLAITPHYRRPEVISGFARAILQESRTLGYTRCISVSGITRSRLYRRMFHACGCRFQIYQHIDVPPEPGFNDLPHILSVGFLDDADDATSSRRRPRRAA